jgi:hypothetical protein
MAMFVGGMTFVFLVLRPGLARHPEEASVREVSSFLRGRFRVIAVFLTAAIVASGILNIIFYPPKGAWRIVLLIVKVLLAGGILYLYFRNAFLKAAVGGAAKPSASAGATPAEGPREWKAAWLLSPSPTQVKIELISIAGVLVVILLGVILTLC